MFDSQFLGHHTALGRALLSAVMLSLAQVELKIATTRIGETIKLFGLSQSYTAGLKLVHGSLFFVFALLGVILWIYALRDSELSKIYWTTAICYLIVPVASSLVLGEHLALRNMAGYAAILFGLLLANRG